MATDSSDSAAMEAPSIISHLSLGTNDYERARDFYEQLLAVLGCHKMLEHPGAAAFGKVYPEFWVQTPINGKPSNVGNGTHVSFLANSKEEVDAFYQKALELGAIDEGEPGPRPDYGAPYYGCFVRDLDGHKIEANFWDMSLMPPMES